MIKPKKDKIAEEQAKHPSAYQSNEHPEHFKSEGSEYIDSKSEKSEEGEQLSDKVDFDKINEGRHEDN